jgi:hypothetical protein
MPVLRRLLRLICMASIFLAAAGCQALPDVSAPWRAADLRLLDPLDAPAPSVEIVALYTRTLGSDLEIRIDLLDLPLAPDNDLVLRLKTPADEITLRLPAEGRPVLTSGSPGLRARSSRDPWLDTVIVRFNRLYVLQPFTMQVSTHLPGESSPADETALVRSDALPPVERAPVMLTFWNAFPAATPAQALRRWDGAHTGPNGGRHGLKNLLDAVEEYELPVTLLDLKTPASLAALDLAGALPEVRRLAQKDLLILPGTAYSQPADAALRYSREAAAAFGLPGSLFVYAAAGGILPGSQDQFLSLPDDSHLESSDGRRFLPLPAAGEAQITGDGPALEVRRRLVEAAFSPDPSDLVSLGGSLPDSEWGAFDMAAPAFDWLEAHPWVWVLGGADLAAFPAGGEENTPAFASVEEDAWLAALRQAPENEITTSAWQTYLMLHAPSGQAGLQALREAYAGQVGTLLAAAAWAGSPFNAGDCARDLDLDGRAECLLANSRYYAVIETNGARLTHLFFLDESGAHQLIAPSSQFTVGLSDPSQWHPDLGEAADPEAVMGAFSDATGTFDEFAATLSGGVLTLRREGLAKTFRLTESGLEVNYQAGGEANLHLPLAVDPQRFFRGPTSYQAVLAPGSWTWGLEQEAAVEVRTDAILAAQGFTVSKAFMGRPEDPDEDYPAGHFFPFPLALVTVRGEGEFTIWIEGK